MDLIFYYQMLILFGCCIAAIIVTVLCTQFFAEQDLRKNLGNREILAKQKKS